MTDPLAAIERRAEELAASGIEFLSALGPYLLVAVAEGVVQDTRSFARIFGVAHALVIRETTSLADELGLLKAETRGDRSQRVFLSVTQAGARLLKLELQNDKA